MEILKGYVGSIEFVVPSGLATATYDVYRGETMIGSPGNAVIDGTVATVTIPYAAVQEEGPVKVTLHFTYEMANYNLEKIVDVVTPILEVHEVKEILGPDSTDEEAREIEAAVRHIIQAHTGQTFGKVTTTITIPGNGNNSLQLPMRLISFTNVATEDAEFALTGFSTAADGWYLRLYQTSILNYKEAPGELSMDHGPVIVTPYSTYYASYRYGRNFAITGTWGYEAVPEAVKEAARLLINDYACSEIAYRDRYLESIKAADWRLQYNSQAWDYTGNVRADQLLSQYVLLNWAVV